MAPTTRPTVLLTRLLAAGWLLAASMCTAAAGATPAPGAAGAPRPNFLVILTDDQRWDALGVVQREQGERGRFPWFQTPHMDRLAAGGVRFRNAFVVNSLCAPSRACYLTGRYSHVNGVANNQTPFPKDNVTHATLLREAGYATGYFGKWHHDGQRDRPGFDRVASYVGQGRFNNCPFIVDGMDTPTQGWVDDVTTDYAIAFLKEHKDKPFDAVVGYKSPHGPRTPPPRAAQRFAGETARPAPNMNARPPYKLEDTRPAAADARQWGDAQLNYFRTISAVDDNLGRLLDALDELNIADRTLVVFASDNGYYLGEHTLGDKRSAYEESLRIPLLVRFPMSAAKGKAVDEMALNIDLAPTLLDYAGVEIPKEMQGRSLRPLLDGEAPREPWRKAFFYEYFLEHRFNVPTTLAVRTTDAKLIRYPGHDDWTELYDLRADPYETKNLAGDPAHAGLLKQMQEEFDRQAKQVDFKVPAYAHERMPAPPATRPRRRR